jgi:arginine repressor
MYAREVSIIKVENETTIVNKNITEHDLHLFEVANVEVEYKKLELSKLEFSKLKEYFPNKIISEITDVERDIKVISEKVEQLTNLEIKYLEIKSKIENDIYSVTEDYGKTNNDSKQSLESTRIIEHNHVVPFTPLNIECWNSKEVKEFFGNKEILSTLGDEKKFEDFPKLNVLGYDSQDPYSKYTTADFSLFKNKFFVTYNTIFEFCVVMDFETYTEGYKYYNIKRLGFLPIEEVELLENSEEITKLNGQHFSKTVFDIRMKFVKDISNTKEENESATLANIIKSNYYITESEKNRIKAVEIMKSIKNLNGKSISFNTLSKILLSMGLKRKRFSDGNYYYGLVLKTEMNVCDAHQFITKERHVLNRKQDSKKLKRNEQQEFVKIDNFRFSEEPKNETELELELEITQSKPNVSEEGIEIENEQCMIN